MWMRQFPNIIFLMLLDENNRGLEHDARPLELLSLESGDLSLSLTALPV